jgi:hypothetical protein
MERTFAAAGTRRGVTPPGQPGGRTGFLDDLIVELGFIDRETADWAVEQGRVEGQAVGAVLVEGRILTEDQLARAIAELHGLDHVDLDAFGVDLDVAQLITRQAARRYKAVPIASDADGTLIVALADPVDPLAVSDVGVMTKSEVKPMVATESQIDAVIAHLHDAPGVPGSAAGDSRPDMSVNDHQAVPEGDYGPIVVPEPEADPAPEPAARVTPNGELAELHAKLDEANEADRRLEQRLDKVLETTAEIRAACEKLIGSE